MTAASNCISKVIGRLDTRSFLRIYPHSCAPCLNLHSNLSNNNDANSLQSFSDMFNELHYSVTYPVPSLQPSDINREAINGIDPALKLVNEKQVWEDYKNCILTYCDQKQVNSIKETRDGEKKVPKNIVLLANHMKRDPDEHFSANYNSYFTGGNAAICSAGSDKYLVSSESDGQIFYSNLNKMDCQLEANNEKVYIDAQISELIYQIEAGHDLFLARHQNAVSLFCLRDVDEGLDVNKQYTFENDLPLTSISTNEGTFCTLSVEREIEIFDISEEKSILRCVMYHDEDVHLSDKWGSAYYINDKMLCYLDRTSVSYIDLRVKADVAQRWYVESVTEDCEEIFCGAKGSKDLQYIVTTHQMCSLDPRIGFTQRWTHGLTHSPALISVTPSTLSMSDKICVGSQRSDGVVFIENDCSQTKAVSKVQPYTLPSMQETLHLSRYNGYCLGNTSSSRFTMSLTGLCCMEYDKGVSIFRVTSCGDVFKQALTKSHELKEIELSDEELSIIEKWEDNCENLVSNQNNPCFVTKLIDDPCLTNIVADTLSSEEESEEPIAKQNSERASWNLSKKELLSYCDYLAPKILEEWGIEEEEEWGNFDNIVDCEESSSNEEEDAEERVMKWIEAYAEEEMNVTGDEQDLEEMANLKVQEKMESPPLKPIFKLEDRLPLHVNETHPPSTPKKKTVAGF